MTESEWFACKEPDLMLEFLVGRIDRTKLVEFVRKCWERIKPFLPPAPREHTVVEQCAASAKEMSDMDAATYASEAALKAAGWAPNREEELRQQAILLRQLVGKPWLSQ